MASVFPRRIANWSDYRTAASFQKLPWWVHVAAIAQIVGEKTVMICFRVAATLWASYVRVKLWAWFVVPALHFPALNIVQMFCLVFFAKSVSYQTPSEKDAVELERKSQNTTWRYFLDHIFRSFSHWLAILFIGWMLLCLSQTIMHLP